MSRHRKDEEKDKAMKNPVEWLFGACLMLLGCAIALNVTMSLLAHIWPWIVGIGSIAGTALIGLRVHANNRRKW